MIVLKASRRTHATAQAFPAAVGTRFADEPSTVHPRFPGNMSNSATSVVMTVFMSVLVTNVSRGDELAEQDSVQADMPATCKGDAVKFPAPDAGCDFAVVNAAEWVARPQRYSQWKTPILITGVAGTGGKCFLLPAETHSHRPCNFAPGYWILSRHCC